MTIVIGRSPEVFHASDIASSLVPAANFFAYESLESMKRDTIREGFVVNGALGEVEIWGNVERTHLGYRSEYVFPRRIQLPEEWWGWYGRTTAPAVDELKAYECTVEQVSSADLPPYDP